MTRRLVLVSATAAYLALVAWATFGTVSWHRIGWEAEYGVLTPSIWLDEATWRIGSPVEWMLNVAMFVPVGLLFALLAGPRRWLGAPLAAVALSAAIEIAQIPIDDRISDPRDLAANSAGAAIGVGIAAAWWLVSAIGRGLARLTAPATEVRAPAPVAPQPASARHEPAAAAQELGRAA